MSPALRNVIKELRAKGFEVEKGRKHVKFRAPSGKLFVTSSTPRCPHSYKNFLHDIEKYQRGEHSRFSEKR